jgi:hypothetical protein
MLTTHFSSNIENRLPKNTVVRDRLSQLAIFRCPPIYVVSLLRSDFPDAIGIDEFLQVTCGNLIKVFDELEYSNHFLSMFGR